MEGFEVCDKRVIDLFLDFLIFNRGSAVTYHIEYFTYFSFEIIIVHNFVNLYTNIYNEVCTAASTGFYV